MSPLADVKRAATWVVLSAVLLDELHAAAFWKWFDDSRIATAIEQTTHGLVPDGWAFQLAFLPIGYFLLRFGRQRPKDLGLVRHDALAALVALPVVYLMIQVCLVTPELTAGRAPSLDPRWREAPAFLGVMLGQVLGSALQEELFYRVFLFRQVHLRFATRGFRHPVLLATLMVSAFFGLMHVGYLTTQFHDGVGPFLLRLLKIAAVGAWYTMFYLRTGNAFLTAVFHGLNNWTSPIWATQMRPYGVAFLLSVALYLAWPRLRSARIGSE